MITATLVAGKVVEREDLEQRLYQLSEPILFGWTREDETEYVVISGLAAAFDTGLPETYIFPADENGEIIDWGELDGSFRGSVDFDKAIADAGWDLA